MVVLDDVDDEQGFNALDEPVVNDIIEVTDETIELVEDEVCEQYDSTEQQTLELVEYE